MMPPYSGSRQNITVGLKITPAVAPLPQFSILHRRPWPEIATDSLSALVFNSVSPSRRSEITRLLAVVMRAASRFGGNTI
jgi:hypothetical protein